MAVTGKTPKFRSLKQQRLDGELGLIIDEMGRAMWNANKEYIGQRTGILPMTLPMTLAMRVALEKFQHFCEEHYGKKA
jgi:hypothetical protein